MATKEITICDFCEEEEGEYSKAVAKCMFCGKDLCMSHACVLKVEFENSEDMSLILEDYDDNQTFGKIMSKKGKIFCGDCWEVRMKTLEKAISKRKASEASFSERFIDIVAQTSIVEAI